MKQKTVRSSALDELMNAAVNVAAQWKEDDMDGAYFTNTMQARMLALEWAIEKAAKILIKDSLIAAGPDLLKVLKDVQRSRLITCNCGHLCDQTCMASDIRAAIAKAEGR